MATATQDLIPPGAQRALLAMSGHDPGHGMSHDAQMRVMAIMEMMSKVSRFPQERLRQLKRDWLAAGRREEVSEFGRIGNINITGLTALIAACPQAFPVWHHSFSAQTKGETLEEFLGHRETSDDRIDRLTAQRLEDPIIILKAGNKLQGIIDGAHRVKARLKRGYSGFDFYPIDEATVRTWLLPADGESVDAETRSRLNSQLEMMLMLEALAVNPPIPFEKRVYAD